LFWYATTQLRLQDQVETNQIFGIDLLVSKTRTNQIHQRLQIHVPRTDLNRLMSHILSNAVGKEGSQSLDCRLRSQSVQVCVFCAGQSIGHGAHCPCRYGEVFPQNPSSVAPDPIRYSLFTVSTLARCFHVCLHTCDTGNRGCSGSGVSGQTVDLDEVQCDAPGEGASGVEPPQHAGKLRIILS